MSTAAVPVRAKYSAPQPDAEVLGRLDEERGWAALPHKIFAHIGRLVSGKPQTLMVFYVWAQQHDKTLRRKVPFDYREMAAVGSCCVRDAQIMLDELCRPVKCVDGKKRSLFTKRNAGKTGARFYLEFLPLEEWDKLPAYVDRKPVQTAETSMPEGEQNQADENQADEESPRTGCQRLPRIRLCPGARSRDLPVKEGVRLVRFESIGFAGEVKTAIQEGEMTVRVEDKNRRTGGEQQPQLIHSARSAAKPISQNRLRSPDSSGPGPCSEDCINKVTGIILSHGAVTKQAISRMLKQCKEFSQEKVILAAAAVSAAVQANGDVRNPVGFLLAMVPKYLRGEYSPRGSRRESGQRPSGAAGRRLSAIEEALRKAREEENRRA